MAKRKVNRRRYVPTPFDEFLEFIALICCLTFLFTL